jgi:CRISPR-associated helicase Cas3/CRISPR-associated endonuclease Cas3-HD
VTTLASYWAKSARAGGKSGESLTSHLDDTFRAATILANRIGDIRCLNEGVRAQFWRVVELAAISHDAGKVGDGFQQMVKGQLRVWPQRHEVLSLGFVRQLIDAPAREWVSLGVATHHRHLFGGDGGCRKPSLWTLYGGDLSPDEFADEFGQVDLSVVAELLDWIARTAGLTPATTQNTPSLATVSSAQVELTELFKRWDGPVDPNVGLTAVLLQGAVTMADHLSSAHASLHPVQPIDSSYRVKLLGRLGSGNRTVRPHQHQAAHTQGHMILRAPTGSGKTEGGLLWAAGQLERIKAERRCVPRLFYSLPYLASINAMAGRLSGELGDPDLVGVAHSRAGSYHLAVSIDCDEDNDPVTQDRIVAAARKAVSRAAATRLFRESVRVGTPYQQLRGALAGPIHSSVLLDCANSVFLLDELHAYDARRLGFILASLGFWEKLGGTIGILSATVPEALVQLIRQSLEDDVTVIDGHGQHGQARHLIGLREHHLTEEPAIDEISARLLEGRSVLVVANNVGHAQDLFTALAPTAEEIHGPDGAHLLHSRFTRRDRNTIEKAILDRYKAGAERNGGLLVATQTIEVSLDLDFDLTHTSGAPLEALLQRFGRVNRLGTRPAAPVIVHQPTYKERNTSTDEFADGIYPAAPTRHGWEILSGHNGQQVDERTTVGWLNEIYDSPWGDEWRTEVTRHQQRFVDDFLTFTTPHEGRDHLEEDFDSLFEGTEAILAVDIDEYQTALGQVAGRSGRLLAEDLLIPLPLHVKPKYNRSLRVCTIDAEYDPRNGLGPIRTAAGPRYIAGEIL